MDLGATIILVIIWLIFGCIAAAGVAEQSGEVAAIAIAFFWPVTIPVLLVFGLFYAIWSSLLYGVNMFKGDK